MPAEARTEFPPRGGLHVSVPRRGAGRTRRAGRGSAGRCVSVVSTGSWGDAPQSDSVDTHVPRPRAALRARAAPPPPAGPRAGWGGGRCVSCPQPEETATRGHPSATDSAPARLAGCVCARLSFQDSEEAEGEGGVAGPRGGCGWIPCCVPAARPAARGCGQRGARRCPPWSPPSLSGRARVSQRLAGEGLRGSDDSAACSWCGADGSLLHWLPSLCCCPDVGCTSCAGVRWPVKGWEHTARL